MNVLITGASRGIGEAVAEAFARDGHRVLVSYVSRRTEAEKVVARLKSHGADADLAAGDVSKPAEAKALVDRVVARWGSLDGLVNNAGTTRDRTLLKMTDEEWLRVIDVNLNGAFWCLRAAAAAMARGGGFVVNVASLLGVRGAVGCANYVASKAGLIGLTKAAARELGRFDIRVNAVLPGFHRTEMSEPAWEARGAAIQKEHALPRLPDREELGRFVLHVAKLTSVSGQVFHFESRVS
jgi:3-oxoacyl-[acyl-carrier protein] reductase